MFWPATSIGYDIQEFLWDINCFDDLLAFDGFGGLL
jgi:hypothetical protein